MLQGFRTVAVALAVLLVVGCAPAPVADFTPSPDRATVYVYRNHLSGGGVRIAVSVDGERVGITKGKTYLLLRLEPGQHAMYSQDRVNTSITLDVAAGKNYYVWQQVSYNPFSFMTRSKLKLVDEATGQAGVAECELAAAEQ